MDQIEEYIATIEEMREKYIEQRLVKDVKAMGGLCLKFVSPNFDGMPDRIILADDIEIPQCEVTIKDNMVQVSAHINELIGKMSKLKSCANTDDDIVLDDISMYQKEGVKTRDTIQLIWSE